MSVFFLTFWAKLFSLILILLKWNLSVLLWIFGLNCVKTVCVYFLISLWNFYQHDPFFFCFGGYGSTYRAFKRADSKCEYCFLKIKCQLYYKLYLNLLLNIIHYYKYDKNTRVWDNYIINAALKIKTNIVIKFVLVKYCLGLF